MADKEKLIRLLCNAHSKSCEASAFDGISYAEQLTMEADFLLENGVTCAKDTNVPRWIPVSERLPDLHDSIFVKGNVWVPGLPRMISDTVLAVVEYEGGKRNVLALQTEDGEWPLQRYYMARAVTHWMPLPEPPGGKAT